MSVTHTIIRSYMTGTDIPPMQCTETITAAGERNISLTIPAQTGSPVTGANYPVYWSADRTKLLACGISATRACTVYTNAPSSGSPQDNIPIVAGQVLDWTLENDGLPRCMFSGSVTIIYVTPPIGGDALVFSINAALTN